MKKVLLVSVLLGGLMVGCSQENEQFSIQCPLRGTCTVDYINNGEETTYYLNENEKLYFNYPDEGQIVVEYIIHYENNTTDWKTIKIDSTKDIKGESAIINKNKDVVLR